MIRVEIPKDIRPFVLRIQDELKKKKSLKLYSQQLTIFHIIREYKKMIEKQTQEGLKIMSMSNKEFLEFINAELKNPLTTESRRKDLIGYKTKLIIP